MGCLKGESGFTLVELMVVVAIIGILASIAVPNFNRYLENGKKKEAQIELTALYARQQTYSTEFSGFTSCLKTGLGYQPENLASYEIGFTETISAVGPSGGPAAPTCGSGTSDSKPGTEGETYFTPKSFASSQPTSGGTAPERLSGSAFDPGTFKTFTIVAEGIIGPSYRTHKNAWSIDQNRNLKELRLGGAQQ